MIGQSVEPNTLEKMKRFLAEHPGIDQLYNVLTMQFGPDAMVAIKARMTPTGSEAGMVALINQIEAEFKTRFSSTAWLFFEPDIED